MITKSHYGLGHATKPGHLPEPRRSVHTCDPQERVDICLECPVHGECKPNSLDCQFNKTGSRSSYRKRHKRSDEILERDQKIKELLNAGWTSKEIYTELRISQTTYSRATQRLREKGEIP